MMKSHDMIIELEFSRHFGIASGRSILPSKGDATQSMRE
jgi:hypothetical protein